MNFPLPQKFGSRVVIPMGDEPLLRYVEAHGFHIESGPAETYVMCRDLHDGKLVKGAEDTRRTPLGPRHGFDLTSPSPHRKSPHPMMRWAFRPDI